LVSSGPIVPERNKYSTGDSRKKNHKVFQTLDISKSYHRFSRKEKEQNLQAKSVRGHFIKIHCWKNSVSEFIKIRIRPKERLSDFYSNGSDFALGTVFPHIVSALE
jgi:hypothetical protein